MSGANKDPVKRPPNQYVGVTEAEPGSGFVVSETDNAIIKAYRWHVGTPFPNCYGDLDIEPLKNPDRAVVSLQAQQPDTGQGHTDQWIMSIIGIGPTKIQVKFWNIGNQAYRSCIVHGLVADLKM